MTPFDERRYQHSKLAFVLIQPICCRSILGMIASFVLLIGICVSDPPFELLLIGGIPGSRSFSMVR